VFGGRPRERFQSGIAETPSVAALAMERAAEAGMTFEVGLHDQRHRDVFLEVYL